LHIKFQPFNCTISSAYTHKYSR